MNIEYIQMQIAKKSTEVLAKCYQTYNTAELKSERERVYRDLLESELERRECRQVL
jgi:Trp operon repressor